MAKLEVLHDELIVSGSGSLGARVFLKGEMVDESVFVDAIEADRLIALGAVRRTGVDSAKEKARSILGKMSETARRILGTASAEGREEETARIMSERLETLQKERDEALNRLRSMEEALRQAGLPPFPG